MKMILATKTDNLPSFLRNKDGFHPMKQEDIFNMFDSSGYWCGPREDLEQNPMFKQIIPYVVVKIGDKYLSYTRTSKGGEGRLYDKLSIGFGGHIDFSDVRRHQDSVDIISTLKDVAAREIIEEIGINEDKYQWIGLVNDESNAVGQVHIGIVCIVSLNKKDLPKKSDDESISEFNLLSLEEIQATELNIETWTKLVVDYLSLNEYLDR